MKPQAFKTISWQDQEYFLHYTVDNRNGTRVRDCGKTRINGHPDLDGIIISKQTIDILKNRKASVYLSQFFEADLYLFVSSLMGGKVLLTDGEDARDDGNSLPFELFHTPKDNAYLVQTGCECCDFIAISVNADDIQEIVDIYFKEKPNEQRRI